MPLIRKTIDSIQIINSAATGYTLRALFTEVDPAFQHLDLNKSIWLDIMDQAEAERGDPYPVTGVAAALAGIRLVFEQVSPTSAIEFKAIEFDDVAGLKSALEALL